MSWQVNNTALISAVSSGGAVAVLAGAGKHAACQLAGVEFDLYFGVSGGAIVNALRALGRTPQELLHLALEEDFSSHVSIKGGVFGSLSETRNIINMAQRLICLSKLNAVEQAQFVSREESWSGTGLLGTKGIGDFVSKHARALAKDEKWPENFCTLATLKDGSQVIFHKDGVDHINLKGQKQELDKKPVSLSFAIRATAAIPGIMAAMEYQDHLLFDGAMSRDGLCPLGVLIRNYGANPEQFVACRVGEDATHFIFGPAQRAVRRLWMVPPDYHWGPETVGVLEFRPPIDHLHSLKFNLSQDEKWFAILISFESCLRSLALSGQLRCEKLIEARTMLKEIGYWRNALPAASGTKQEIAERAAKVFSEHGLF